MLQMELRSKVTVLFSGSILEMVGKAFGVLPCTRSDALLCLVLNNFGGLRKKGT